MSFLPRSIPYMRSLQQRRLRQDYARVKEIRDLAALNFDTWAGMSDVEKDATMRQMLRGMSELAGILLRAMRYELGDLKDD